MTSKKYSVRIYIDPFGQKFRFEFLKYSGVKWNGFFHVTELILSHWHNADPAILPSPPDIKGNRGKIDNLERFTEVFKINFAESTSEPKIPEFLTKWITPNNFDAFFSSFTVIG